MVQMLCLFFVAAFPYFTSGRKDFACSSDEFECTKTQTCTRLKWRCDGEEDCFDGEDEVDCPPTTCKPGFFKCKSGRCIEQSWVCDKHNDCPDNDDEAPTQQCKQTTCRPDDFQCRNGECIKGSYKCDHEDDCQDKSDEANCTELVCKSTEFKCANNLTCISLGQKCNGVHDCEDESDEKDCPQTCNPISQFTCGNGHCFPLSYRCDDDKDCLDNSDEQDCPTQPPKTCPSNEYQCNDGNCIPRIWKCDGTADCYDRTDEEGCPPTCSNTQFTCVQSGKCISTHSKCDGVRDCLDGSDELDCALCDNLNSYRCGKSSYCINETKVCDGNRDCPDGDDEALNCGINECNDHNGHCIHHCRDLPIGYECYCNHGYKLANDSRSCEDLNECVDLYASCSQKCSNTKGSFRCDCVEGYRMGPSAVDTCRATGPPAFLVFGGEHTIHNVTISGDRYGNIVSNRRAPIAISYNLESGYVYWSDVFDEKIERFRLFGNGTVETVVDKVKHSNGLAIDWIGKKLYWTDETFKSVEVSELNGKNRLKLFIDSVDAPRGIALDPFERYIFWADWSGVHPKIERASMDGNLSSRQVILDTDVVWPTALTIDTIAQRLYFADTKLRRIETIKYDGTTRHILISEGLVHPLGLAVFEDRLCYTDYSLNAIYTVNRRTGQRLGEVRKDLKRPTGIAIVHPLRQKQVASPCSRNNGGCSHLCLLSSTSSRNYTCRCPNELRLQSDGRSCAKKIGPKSTPKPPVQTTGVQSTRKVLPTGKVSSSTKGSKGSPLAKKQGSSSNSGPMIAGVTVGILVFLFLLVVALLYWRRRSKMADRSILFYKDSSTTPLQNDFDEDLRKSHEDIVGMSRIQFT